jgi:hypothetical protein
MIINTLLLVFSLAGCSASISNPTTINESEVTSSIITSSERENENVDASCGMVISFDDGVEIPYSSTVSSIEVIQTIDEKTIHLGFANSPDYVCAELTKVYSGGSYFRSEPISVPLIKVDDKEFSFILPSKEITASFFYLYDYVISVQCEDAVTNYYCSFQLSAQ